ncbi:Auxin responsive SAUR protein [Corchorus olitorius]|uniref:Auxin responsive SAUR protein n=1 Tax=Corchorus olitorius TaxID=93759 RepID=A0A1R3JAZ1_9ROSI|nr:Auxin responsive SAUR protein [Corchorus olitorius]
MISAKKLIKLARKWQKLAAIRRKRITSSGSNFGDVSSDSCSTSSSTTVEKGHFVVYSADEKRFVLPLQYLKNDIVRELFSLAEEEFGLPSDSPLKLPCDTVFLEYVITLIKRRPTKDVEKALLTSIANGCCSYSSLVHQQSSNQQLLVCSF